MNIFRLDEVKGAIRVLYFLAHHLRAFQRMELLTLLRKEGVGQNSAYRSIEVLKSLKLVREIKIKKEGKRGTFTYISSEGREVMKRLLEIEEILENINT